MGTMGAPMLFRCEGTAKKHIYNFFFVLFTFLFDQKADKTTEWTFWPSVPEVELRIES